MLLKNIIILKFKFVIDYFYLFLKFDDIFEVNKAYIVVNGKIENKFPMMCGMWIQDLYGKYRVRQ